MAFGYLKINLGWIMESGPAGALGAVHGSILYLVLDLVLVHPSWYTRPGLPWYTRPTPPQVHHPACRRTHGRGCTGHVTGLKVCYGLQKGTA